MSATYDEAGNYQYPDGFDPETNEWLPGHEEQQAEWERQYAEARTRFEAHMKQVEEAAEGRGRGGRRRHRPAPSTYSSEAPAATDEDSRTRPPAGGGTLASDEALAALREKLTGG